MKTKIEIFGIKNQNLVKELKQFLQTLLKDKSPKKLSVIFVNSDYIRKLNRKYLGRNRITDVLAFPFDDEFLGEVYVCRQRAKKQAKEYGLTEKEEIFRLVKHGLMHLLGRHH
ncbi:MAG: rRNA maturation RNase YbeY [bacterium]